ncbi:flagellar filament capping protein FliD [Alteromonas sp. S015]|uniref:flagellar filament capping protein FliD n=1 Tax=Alteromonas sp. S015 TaxID=3117401 RepID=UPI002FE2FEF3
MAYYEQINPSQLASQFTQLDRQSREATLNARETQIQRELSAISGLKTDMQDLLSILEEFSGIDGNIIRPKATSANESVLSVSTDAKAQPANYTLRVNQLAVAHQVAIPMTNVTLPTDGEMVISTPDGNIAVDLASLPASASLRDLASAINDSASNTSVNVSVINSGSSQHLVITGKETGAASQFTVAFNPASDPSGATFENDILAANVMSVGQDAIVSIGNDPATAIQVTSASNTLENVIEGVSLELHATSTDSINLAVTDDTESVQASLQDFVDGYNEIVDRISSEDGALYRDGASRQVVSQLRSLISSQYEGQSLYSIGIEFDRDGHLTIDANRLNKALEDSPTLVNDVLSGENGLFQAMDTRLTEYTNSTGLLVDRTNSLQDRLELVNNQQERFSALMDLRYERYLSEFTALQRTMAQMETSMTQFS